jgi:hypothetical protein
MAKARDIPQLAEANSFRQAAAMAIRSSCTALCSRT